MGFYERLEELRKNAGIGQGKLEKELEIANGSISKWKNRMPKYATLEKIAKYFNVSVDYLVKGSSNEVTLNHQHAADLFSGIGGLKKEFLPDTVYIQIIDEPEIHLHSKSACDLVKIMVNMPEEDLAFLANTAKKISPNENNTISFLNTSLNTEKKNSKVFTDVQNAKQYLNTLGNSLAAFGGGKELSDEAVIKMANIIYNDKHK